VVFFLLIGKVAFFSVSSMKLIYISSVSPRLQSSWQPEIQQDQISRAQLALVKTDRLLSFPYCSSRGGQPHRVVVVTAGERTLAALYFAVQRVALDVADEWVLPLPRRHFAGQIDLVKVARTVVKIVKLPRRAVAQDLYLAQQLACEIVQANASLYFTLSLPTNSFKQIGHTQRIFLIIRWISKRSCSCFETLFLSRKRISDFMASIPNSKRKCSSTHSSLFLS
jgi:hypothetical protein